MERWVEYGLPKRPDTMLDCFEESNIRNDKLPAEWQSQSTLDELSQFLQTNWEQRSVFYNDGEITNRQQFITQLSQENIQ